MARDFELVAVLGDLKQEKRARETTDVRESYRTGAANDPRCLLLSFVLACPILLPFTIKHNTSRENVPG